MKNIILLAPQSAGKGTQALKLKEKYNIPHISTGEMLRRRAAVGDKLGNIINDMQLKGVLVTPEIVYQVLEERITETDCNNGYILDGFPRSMEQALKYDEILAKYKKEIGYVILLDITREEVMKRITGRRICSKCGRNYNINYDNQKPKCDSICDDCGSELIIRSDDTPEGINTRLNTYYEKTTPLIEYYGQKNVLYKVDGSKEPDEVFKQIEEIIKGDE